MIHVLALLVAGLISFAADPAPPPADASPVRVAVLEFADKWTKQATGAAALLKDAGAEVVPLDLDRGLNAQDVDLAVFGTFANNAETYRQWMTDHADSVADFIRDGGVVLELAQSDQYDATPPWLPGDAVLTRNDRDLGPVRIVAPAHPLIRDWLGPRSPGDEIADFDRAVDRPTSWESLDDWRNLQVLLAVGPGPRRPALVEGSLGDGRFLVTSLWIDKVFGPDGTPVVDDAAVAFGRRFFASLVNHVDAVRRGAAPAVEPTPAPGDVDTGPLVGFVDASSAMIWMRPRTADHVRVELDLPDGSTRRLPRVAVDPDRDRTAVVTVDGLAADTSYPYRVFVGDDPTPRPGVFRTAPTPGRPARVVLGIGSCASSEPDGIWTRILDEDCDALLLIGDTPYIDTTDLTAARRRHRGFLQVPEAAETVARMAVHGTWDDHDFGGNDTAGNLPGKENTRRAFSEYRPQPTHGVDGEGIFHSFRRGPVEVFMIDARWFAATEPSFADPSKPTLLGARQWAWLQEGLRTSTAPFKLLVTGMIWDDKKNSERDDWGTYAHERDAIERFIGEEGITGCVLVGGDIHCSRALKYDTTERCGYDLRQLIVSPMHDGVIPSLNVPHPALVDSVVHPHVFLRLVVDDTREPAELVATWIDRDGTRMMEMRMTEEELGRMENGK